MPWIINPKHAHQPNPRRWSVPESLFRSHYHDWIVVKGPKGKPTKEKADETAEEDTSETPAPSEEPRSPIVGKSFFGGRGGK